MKDGILPVAHHPHMTFKMLKALLERGSDPNFFCNSYPAIVFRLNQLLKLPKKLELLCEYGLNVNLQDFKGDTPLHHFMREKDLDCISWLVEKGAQETLLNLKKEKCWDVIGRSQRIFAPEKEVLSHQNQEVHDFLAQKLIERNKRNLQKAMPESSKSPQSFRL